MIISVSLHHFSTISLCVLRFRFAVTEAAAAAEAATLRSRCLSHTSVPLLLGQVWVHLRQDSSAFPRISCCLRTWSGQHPPWQMKLKIIKQLDDLPADL
jgi:hypothetical protein